MLPVLLQSQPCATSDAPTLASREMKSLWWVRQTHNSCCLCFSESTEKYLMLQTPNSSSMTSNISNIYAFQCQYIFSMSKEKHVEVYVGTQLYFVMSCQNESHVCWLVVVVFLYLCCLSLVQRRETPFLWVSTTCPSVSALPSSNRGKEPYTAAWHNHFRLLVRLHGHFGGSSLWCICCIIDSNTQYILQNDNGVESSSLKLKIRSQLR